MWQLLTFQMTVLNCSFPPIFWLSRVQNAASQLVQSCFGSSPFYEAKNGPENVLNFSRACMHDREHFWSKKLFSMFLILKDMHFWGPVFFHSDFWLVPKNGEHIDLGRVQISWKFGPPNWTCLYLQEGLKKCYNLVPKTPGGRVCIKNWLIFDPLFTRAELCVGTFNPLIPGYG